jgi:hypothetical protein
VWDNLRKEAPGLRMNEQVWTAIDQVRLRGDSFRGCYIEIAEGLDLPGDYWAALKKAMRVWADLFD